MLGRVLSLVAALLLSCASTNAHAYAKPLHSETARQGFATTDHDAHRERARVTADAASENSSSITEPSDGRRFYAKARYYGAGRGSFISVDPWEGDATQPLSYNKYLYGYSNPGVYIDPDGRNPFTAPAFRYVYANSDRERSLALQSGAPQAAMVAGGIYGVLKPGIAATEFAGDVAAAAGGDADAAARAQASLTNVAAGLQQTAAGIYNEGPYDYARLRVTDSLERIDQSFDEGDYFGGTSEGAELTTTFVGAAAGGVGVTRAGASMIRSVSTPTHGVSSSVRDVPQQTARAEGRLAITIGEGLDGNPVARASDLLQRSLALDPSSDFVYSVKDARRLGGENRGAIFVREPQRSGSAAEFEAGSANAFSDVASQRRAVPALRFDNPNPRGNNFVRFDGYEDGGLTLVDRKTQLTTGTKQLADIERVSRAAAQNPGYRVVYEFPTPEAAASARRILESQEIDNIAVRVADQ